MTTKKKKFEIDLNIKNFGPHKNLHFPDKMSTIHMGIFANNGQVKRSLAVLLD